MFPSCCRVGHGTARRWLTTVHGQRVLPQIERAAARYRFWSLFLSRYVYGARIATMLFWGMRRIPYRWFLALSALNCLIWASVFGSLGYLFANSVERLIGELRHVESWLLVGVLSFAVLLGIRHYLAERGRTREENRMPGP